MGQGGVLEKQEAAAEEADSKSVIQIVFQSSDRVELDFEIL